jgi:Double zinc ribbon
MNCPRCGAPLPENARFCLACGQPLAASGAGAPPPPPPPPNPPAPSPAASAPTIAAPGVTQLKCPACGAPIQPTFGEMVVTCEYCGASVSLGGSGWKAISKHSMLTPKLLDAAAALAVVRGYVDQGFFHRHVFEESQVAESRLSFVPFWIIPASANTTYQFQDIAVGVGGTVASIAASEMLGAALSGNRRGGFAVIPVLAAPPVNPTRSDTISGMYEYPVVAVKGMVAYQPKDYQFALPDRTFFDRKQLPGGATILNGDLGEDTAQSAAKGYVAQLQAEAAHKKHYMVSSLSTTVEVSEGELLHVPIWYFQLDHKGQKITILVDAHSARVIRTVGA